MTQILNKIELAQFIKGAPVTTGHEGLLTALHARYPDTPFRLIAEHEGRTWNVGLIDKVGNRVTDKLGQWVNQELALVNGDARKVWMKHKDSGLVRTERDGSVLYLTAPFGTNPDAFYQIEVMVGPEITTKLQFDPKTTFPPEDRHDLVSGSSLTFSDSERQILSPPQYEFEELVNMRQYLRTLVEVENANRLADLPELEKRVIHIHDIVLGPEGGQASTVVPYLDMCPDYLTRTPHAVRFFQDWQESSAGRSGARLCDHWWIRANDYVGADGRRHLYLCPQWADADGGLDLPKIAPDWDDSPYGVMESLSQFDKMVDYPFAWYFFMLHGNRIQHSAGGVVAIAIREGKMNPLPECDEKVLMRWKGDGYGF